MFMIRTAGCQEKNAGSLAGETISPLRALLLASWRKMARMEPGTTKPRPTLPHPAGTYAVEYKTPPGAAYVLARTGM